MMMMNDGTMMATTMDELRAMKPVKKMIRTYDEVVVGEKALLKREDGEYVRTSAVVSYWKGQNGLEMVETANTVYRNW